MTESTINAIERVVCIFLVVLAVVGAACPHIMRLGKGALSGKRLFCLLRTDRPMCKAASIPLKLR